MPKENDRDPRIVRRRVCAWSGHYHFLPAVHTRRYFASADSGRTVGRLFCRVGSKQALKCS
jgi:hypothetical protein